MKIVLKTLLTCFSHGLFENYEHIYITALYLLKIGWMPIFIQNENDSEKQHHV